MEASSSSVCVHRQDPMAVANGRWIVSGGFAIVQPNSVLSINAVEGYALEDFSIDAVRSQITEAQKIIGGSGSEQDIAEAKIELEVSADVWGVYEDILI